ncbi:DUF4198 domain-containing protein [Desulfonatronovibrio magnus]|uniref:DUF4198 domain-containing protein n=1 Tax=Desulfonatronovibrio magnus TaxID=698827 RepID=UPI000A00AEDB|nr:DUF4198 domain-containing protein [Desulfonatronovibrio magnus]
MTYWFKTLCASVLIMLATATLAMAHCIWTEVPFQVNAGQNFKLKAFFAHADDPLDERELTNLNLFIFTPGGDTKQVDLTELDNHYEASVTLANSGQHIFVLERDPNRYRLTEIRDFSKSVVWASQAGSLVHDPVDIPLEIVPVEITDLPNGHKQLTVQVLYDGQPVSGGEIEVFESLEPTSILYDEIAEYDVPADGKVTFTINPELRYVLETDHRVPAREVAGTGIAITEVRFRSTLYIGSM